MLLSRLVISVCILCNIATRKGESVVLLEVFMYFVCLLCFNQEEKYF